MTTKNINSETALRAAILELESKQTVEGEILKEQLYIAYESMKPISLIKNTFKEIAASKEIRDTFFTTSVGLATSYLSKKLFEGVSHSPSRKLFVTVLKFGITNAVRKNQHAVKSVVKGIFRLVTALKPRNMEHNH